MDRKKIAFVMVVMMMPFIASYLLFTKGVLSMSELGLAIVGGLFTLAGVILYLLLWDDIHRWWEGRKSREPVQDVARIDSPKSEKLEQELTLLINPLYAKLNRDREIIDLMTTFITARPWRYRHDDPKTSELEKLEADIKELMRQYGYLSEPIYGEIQTFFRL